MKDDELPPLPPPLPPTHSRSFSSSSSSSAGSPQPPPAEWTRRVATETRRRESPREDDSDGTQRTNGGGTVAARAMRATRSEAMDSSTSSRGGDYTLDRSTPSRVSPQPPSNLPSKPTSTTPTIDPPPNNSTQRTRASAFLSKVSPSLSSHSRYSSSPSNIANIGLRGSPEPLGLGIGGGNLTRHLGGLPSPPPTNSDGGSLEGGSRYGTVRSNGTEASARSGSEYESGGNISPLKPDRPPKSERRSSTITPTKEVPSIGRISPSIAGSSTNSPSRSSSVNERFRRSDSAASFRRSGSPSPVSSLTPSASLRSLDRYASDGSGSEAMEELRDSLVGVEPRRRLRARTGSEGPQEVLDTDEAERRRDLQSRKANELKEKNQKILDSINSQLLPLVSPPSSRRGISPSPSHSSSAPRQTIQRSSTSSTIRSLAAGEDDLIRDSQPNFSAYGNSTDEDDLPRPRFDRTLRSASSTDLGEFGVPQAEAIRRSATLGDVSDHLNNFDRDRNARTAGYRSKPRTSLPQQFDDTLPNRSATSMSNYPSTAERIRARRSDLVGSERTRAASSFGDTRQQDSDFSEGMRRLASRELLRTPRDRSKSQSDALDSPSPSSIANNVSPPSLRNRPALPTEFRQTPPSTSSSTYTRTPRRSLETSTARLTPSSSSSRDLDRFSRPRSTNPSLVSPISSSSSSVSPQDIRRQARSEVSFDDGYSGDDQEGDQERERTPKSAKKAAFDRVGSVGRARTSLGSIDRRTSSVSDSLDRPYSRMSRDERRSGRRSPGASSRGTATPPPPSSARSEDRYSTGADLSARRERMRKSEVGSAEWMAELDNLRSRGTRSRASGISGDGRSEAGDRPPRSPSALERDRTVKAINALLAGQGIVATAVDPSSPTNSNPSPTKRTSTGAYERHRRISFANGTHIDSPTAPGSNTMTCSNSNTSRAGSESVLQGLINQSSSGDHHKLLLSAFDQFDRHFSQDQAETPESIELVKRMVTLISSTTKLNNGLRALTEAIKEEQVQAQLDEGQRNPTISITQFEKSINALLRSSDDQVRNLSEDLIAFTRVERERDRIRKDPETLSRPVSRAGGSSHKPLPLASPPKRPTTASSLEGATVSLSSSRSPVVSREILRNPLEDPNDSLPPRRSTLHFGGRSPFAATDSPSPASRRDLTSQRSPLASETNFETPSRRQSISTSSTFSSGTGGSGGRPSNRRAKYSDLARSPSQSGAVPFPTATHSAPIPQVDATPAITGQSPTRVAAAFPKRPVEGQARTYSGASADAIAFEALEMAANVDEARSREERAAALDRLEQSRAYSPTSSRSIILTPPSESKRPRTRSSMGALGSALKNAFKKAKDPVLDSGSSQVSGMTPRGSFENGSQEDRRIERRKEVENILRRSGSQS